MEKPQVLRGNTVQSPQYPANLVPFTEEILNGKLHFLFSVCYNEHIAIFCDYSEWYITSYNQLKPSYNQLVTSYSQLKIENRK